VTPATVDTSVLTSDRGAQARQLQRRGRARHEDHLDSLRQVTEQALDLRVALVVVHQVVIIQNQDDRRPQGAQARDEGRQQHASLPGHQHLRRIDIELRAGAAHRADHFPPQSAGVVVAMVEGRPGEPAAVRGGTPLADQDGLP
jgi:hypothetical protein